MEEENFVLVCTGLSLLALTTTYPGFELTTLFPQVAVDLKFCRETVSLALHYLMRFGVEMSTDHTLEEVGKQFDVTRERIRQIEAKALRKLRHPSRSDKLKSFLEGN